MNFCTNLHNQFLKSLEEKSYLALSEAHPPCFESVATKKIRLQEVFKIAINLINQDLQQLNLSLSELDIALLKKLEKDGENYYVRYTNSTNTWSRWALKELARYTPARLKPFLPNCFSNRMEAAEKETKDQYEAYKKLLEDVIPRLPNPLDSQRENLDVEGEENEGIIDEEDLAASNFLDESNEIIVKPISSEEIEKKRQQDIACHLNTIRELIQYLNQFNQSPFTSDNYKKVMRRMVVGIRVLSELDPDNVQKSLEELGLSANTFNVLANKQFTEALALNDEEKLIELLEKTEWKASFAEAVAQKGFLQFNVQRLANTTFVNFQTDAGKRINERDIKNYRGTIVLVLSKVEGAATSDDQALGLLQNLVQFLQTNKEYRPNKIEIQLAGRSLNYELFKLLLTLSETVSEIKLDGLEVINFTELGCSAAEEQLFIERLNRFNCSNLKEVILLDSPKTDWTMQNFSQLLAAYPQMNLLKKFYHICPVLQDIVIPPQLLEATTLDLSECPLDSISHLLKQFPLLRHVNLNGLQISDNQLKDWIKQGYFSSVISLKLEGCNSLTTDSLYFLTSLPHLTRLSLPDLPKGQVTLSKLPKFHNPFKIKLFYTASKATQDIATNFYKGPSAWAAVFQIPLAHAGVVKIFNSQMTILDPKSVAYWLYQEDYKKLTPQKSITTILADTNIALNDDNIVEFLQKFPNINTLSLYHCPTITNQGIIKLLKAFPNLQNIDLTGCSQITNELFFGDLDFTTLSLETLNITETGISHEEAEAIKQQVGSKIVFTEAVLKITNDQLTDEGSIQNILYNQTLNHLRRIDLTGCENLTNQMLGQLLDRLNADAWIPRSENDGIFEDNPQRLNLAVLNLTGCTTITDRAFQTENADGKTEFKQLGTLDRIIKTGTQISQGLEKVYHQVTFQEEDQPDSIQINPEVQLQACQTYNKKKQLAMQGDEGAEKELKKLSQTMIHNRVVVELFSSSYENQEFVELVLSESIDTNAEEFCNFTLSFRVDEQANDSTHTHRDVLLSQSLFFIDSFRPGGALSKTNGLDFEFNKNHPAIADTMKGLFFGQIRIEELDYTTAAAIAEPVGSNSFNLFKSFYEKLLSRIHSLFDLSRLEDMMLLTVQLKDEEGLKKYEDELINHLDLYSQRLSLNDQGEFAKIAVIAFTYQMTLKRLQTKVTEIQEIQSTRIARQLNDQGFF